MNPDRAAELLQIPERGLDLLRRYEEDEPTKKAIEAINAGFPPADVAAMFGLPYDGAVLQEEDVPDGTGSIYVYECPSKRCRQKGRVATSSIAPDDEENDGPTCPSCREPMRFVKAVEFEEDIADMKRTFLPRARMADPLGRTDRAGSDKGGDDDD